MASYTVPKQRWLFDTSERLEELHKLGDPLARLDAVIDWSIFEPVMRLIPKAEPKGPGVRPGFPPLLMFKVLIIGHLYKKPEMTRQKDLDACWTKKNDEKHYGCKNHVKVDSKSKLIDAFTGAHAAVHDSRPLNELLAKRDPTTYVDSAYTGPDCEAAFERKGVASKLIERAYRNKPLTARQRKSNRTKSSIRVRV